MQLFVAITLNRLKNIMYNTIIDSMKTMQCDLILNAKWADYTKTTAQFVRKNEKHRM